MLHLVERSLAYSHEHASSLSAVDFYVSLRAGLVSNTEFLTYIFGCGTRLWRNLGLRAVAPYCKVHTLWGLIGFPHHPHGVVEYGAAAGPPNVRSHLGMIGPRDTGSLICWGCHVIDD